VGDKLRAVTRIVGKHKRVRPQTCLYTMEDVCIQALGSVEEHKIGCLGKFDGQRLECVSLANLNKIDEACFCQVFAGPCCLGRLKLRRGDSTTTIVPKGRG
jgi:hypothetical protein